MSETKNVEQKASGARIEPRAWLCASCGTFSDHDKKPDGCKPCEAYEDVGDWQPLWGTDAIVATAGFVATRAGFYGDVKALAKDVFEMLTGVKR
jgi:hypothetical protein